MARGKRQVSGGRVRRGLAVALLAIACAARVLTAQASARDEWLRTPVDDRTYRGFLQFFTYDHSLPFGVRAMERDTLDGIPREHLTFESTSGQHVAARVYRAAGSAGQANGWIVLLHGGSPPGKDGAGNRFAASFLSRAGWNVLALDMLYYGERRTDRVTASTTSEYIAQLYSQQALYLDWVAQTVKDAGRAFDYLVQQRAADPRHIVLVGVSRGAVASSIVGGADPRFAAVALLYAGHHLSAESVRHLPAACPANYIGRVTPRPLLMVNGARDVVFDRDSTVLPLQRLAKEPKKVVWVETGHVESIGTDLLVVAAWLREAVK